MGLVLVIGAALVCPVALYLAASSPEVWGQRQVGVAPAGTGAYRAAEVPTWAAAGAPVVVRVAAFTSLLLGQVLVPGVFAALAGLFFVLGRLTTESPDPLALVLVVSAPTGLLTAALLLAAGFALLRRGANAGPTARRAARAEMLHHASLLLGVIVAAIAGDGGELVPCSAVAAFAAASLGHSVLLRRAARAVDGLAAPDAVDALAAPPA